MNKSSNQDKIAIFAGGCFWCMEAPFKQLPGVKTVVVGYTGGRTVNPTYQQVSQGNTGHLEAVQITYDPSQISFADLLNTFWQQIDPTDAGGQFADRGHSYQTAIFYSTNEEKTIAHESKAKIEKSGIFNKPIVTTILPIKDFYPAEEYHQNYHTKNPLQYKMYQVGSGRSKFLKETWQ